MSLLSSFAKASMAAVLVAGTLSTLVGGTVYTRVEGTTIDLQQLQIEPKPTIIYDKNGEVMARFKKEKKDVTNFEEIPNEIIHAVVSTEDRAFYDHPGINIKAITRAAYAIFQADGDLVQGGSTLTQQLTKTIYLTTEKKLDRKIKEAVLSTALEKEMSKNEILANYLNHIFYGNQAYGIRSAVETYYGQSLEEFKKDDRVDRIAKAALLGGMPQLPSANNPYVNPEAAKQRRDAVLANMWTEGFITKAEYEEAKKRPFLILDNVNDVHDDETIKYGEVVSYVLEETAQLLETDLEGAKFSGRQIYTSFDPAVYEIIREKFDQDDMFPTSDGSGELIQGSMTIVNPNNGEIIAMTGGREKPTFLGLNRAYQSQRQPGSSFKPIISYGPALESGKFHPWSVLVDQAGYNFGGYTPKNFSGGGNGKMVMVDALTKSQNIPAVYLLQQTGINYAINYAERFGIEFTDKDRYLPIALGGLSKGVSTMKMADAYQAYANGGYRIPAHIIKRMVSHDGEVEFEADNVITDENRIIKAQTAEHMRYMLINAVERGTGTNAKIPNEIVAGKTGTTDGNKDIWFTGYTNEWVASVWMGYDNPKSLPVTSWVAAKMFGSIGQEVAKLYPDGDAKYSEPKKIKPEVLEVELKGTYDDSTNTVSLSWSDEKETVYTVERNGEVIAKDLKINAFKDADIEAGKDYVYQVVGYNTYTNFETYTSTALSLSIPKKDPPASTALKSSVVKNTSVALTWSEVKGATNYILIRDGKQIYAGLTLSFAEQDLVPNKEYTYQLIVENKNGKSSPSTLKVKTIGEQVPQTPTQEPDEGESPAGDKEGSSEEDVELEETEEPNNE